MEERGVLLWLPSEVGLYHRGEDTADELQVADPPGLDDLSGGLCVSRELISVAHHQVQIVLACPVHQVPDLRRL